jgi:hypothetical protein
MSASLFPLDTEATAEYARVEATRAERQDVDFAEMLFGGQGTRASSWLAGWKVRATVRCWSSSRCSRTQSAGREKDALARAIENPEADCPQLVAPHAISKGDECVGVGRGE